MYLQLTCYITMNVPADYAVADPVGGAPGACPPFATSNMIIFIDFHENSSSAKSNYYVFGIIGKRFENAREWC